ncbi:hypothetical protein [Thermococcus gammatolerans]|uniref:Coenzyme Q-binding protein COQ10 START domain-containing protein n=1 Tax=Thermococcus gammatolerans (strain DSM 15229 / JCM 11827 / EJ3) TaxID=593117 RepID=C5A5B2_THEGJ|nr:hypothetical protein [Thermococcus gammatolerans]ACS33424.1 Conserved hypothetical protein [Thermococcus gammatolerans EJ3]
MKTKTCEVDLPYNWDVVVRVISKPEKTLPFFPYFESIEGDTVRFNVPRFMAKIGYEFKLSVAVQENRAVYTFTGDRGILTVVFEMEGKHLKVIASWSGFAELIMGKPLQKFVNGIANAVKEFCSAEMCPLTLTGDEGYLDFKTVCSLFKKTAMEMGGDFLVECTSEDGTVLKGRVHEGNLVEVEVIEPSGRKTTVRTEIPVLEVDEDLFKDLPLEKRFRIRVKRN